MGQYYIIIFLESSENTKVLCWLSPSGCVKLMEHSYLDNPYVKRTEAYLIPGAPFHKTPLLWSGDYADVEEGDKEGRNMYNIAQEDFAEVEDSFNISPFRFFHKKQEGPEQNTEFAKFSSRDYPFIANHTLREFVNKYPPKVEKKAMKQEKEDGEEEEEDDEEEEERYPIHPLPLLCCEGNGRGGGDYCGTDMHLVGRWARHVISLEKEPPQGFTELKCKFH